MKYGTELTPDPEETFKHDITGEHLVHKDFPKLSVVPSEATFAQNIGTLDTKWLMKALAENLQHINTYAKSVAPYVQGVIHIRRPADRKTMTQKGDAEMRLQHNFPPARHRNRGATLLGPEKTTYLYTIYPEEDQLDSNTDMQAPHKKYSGDTGSMLSRIISTNILKEYLKKSIQEKRERFPETTGHLNSFINAYNNINPSDISYLHSNVLHSLHPRSHMSYVYPPTISQHRAVSYADALAHMSSRFEPSIYGENIEDIYNTISRATNPKAKELAQSALNFLSSYFKEKRI